MPVFRSSKWLSSDEPLDHARAHAQLLLEDCVGEAPAFVSVFARSPLTWTPDDWLAVFGSMLFLDFPKVFLGLMETDTIDCARFPAPLPRQKGLLHIIAIHAAEELMWATVIDMRMDTAWLRQVRAYAEAGAALHCLDDNDCTPFMLFLEILRFKNLFWGPLRSAVHSWAKALQLAGIELLAYGEAEQAIIASNAWYQELLADCGIIGFFYDTEPEHWGVWLRQPGDIYTGIFWDGIERREQFIPGSWQEEEDDPAIKAPFEKWARTGRPRWICVKRRVVRRLLSQYRHAAAHGCEQAKSMHVCVQQLQKDLTQYGRLLRARATMPDSLLESLEQLVEALGFPGTYYPRSTERTCQ